MEFKLGQRVSLKPNIAETWFDNICAALSRTTGPSHRAKIVPPNATACWHSSCRVVRIFHDGGLLLENDAGYVRQASPNTVIKRYD
jgi:hypothetical protein